MKLHELLKVITHSNYNIAMMNIADVYELLSKFDIYLRLESLVGNM